MSVIYLAGGCFWGTEKYISLMNGVISTEVGYANGKTENPTYDEVCSGSGHAEVVKVEYNKDIISLNFLLYLFYKSINPVSLNRQGGDTGIQYRTGIYYVDENDKFVIENSITNLQKKYNEPIAIEIKSLESYFKAEEYHQKYLEKNPYGYCHIGAEKFQKSQNAIVNPELYTKLDDETLKEILEETQYNVTQKSATEPSFQNEYFHHFEEGIYVDITTGEPLFSSNDKFDSGSGWPSFYKPIDQNVIKEHVDYNYGMLRTEVKSRVGDAHLGHVFEDGPYEKGGLRYCINSSALRFIPKTELAKEGYGYLMQLFR